MKKGIVVILTVLAACAWVFAAEGLGDITLTRVGFIGTIGPVGSGKDSSTATRSSVTIEGKSGSDYTIGTGNENWISSITLSGSGKITFKNCDISGEIKVISGNPEVKFEACTLGPEVKIIINGSPAFTLSNCTMQIQDELYPSDGTVKTPAIKGSGMTGGSFTISCGTIANPERVTMNFSGGKPQSFSISGTTLTPAGKSPFKEIDLTNDTSLTSISLPENIRVSTLRLTGCTNQTLHSNITSMWGHWNVANLYLDSMRLTGSVWISNEHIQLIDLSRNTFDSTGITSISIEGSTSGLKKVLAGDCTIKTADITMNVSDSNSLLDLSGNNLSRNTTLKWGISGETTVETSTYPSDQNPPASPSAGSSYYKYTGISGPSTRWVTCSTCGGDGRVNEHTVQGSEITEQLTPEEYAEWQAEHPGQHGSHIQGSSGGTSYEYYSVGTGQYEDPEEVSDPCPTCMNSNGTPKVSGHTGQIQETYYTSTRITYLYSSDFGLSINGHAIHTSYDAGTVQSDLYMDFTSEWSELEGLNVKLKDNGICYRGSFPASTSYDKWTICFKITTKGLNSSDYVAIFDCDENGPADNYTVGNGYYTLYSNFNVGASRMTDYSSGYQMFSAASGSGDEIDYRGIPKHTFPTASDGATRSGQRYQPFTVQDIRKKWSSFPANGSCYVMLYRDVNTWGSHWADNDEAARGPDFAVYPFGESSLYEKTSWPGRTMDNI